MSKLMASMLVKSLAPTISNLAQNGKIDGFIKHLKDENSKYVELMDSESVEIMVTSEEKPDCEEGVTVEYVSLVVFDSEDKKVVKVLNSRPIGDMIVSLMASI